QPALIILAQRMGLKDNLDSHLNSYNGARILAPPSAAQPPSQGKTSGLFYKKLAKRISLR
ncbi:MAG: hypothetical protein KDE34_29250, partial [Anaerolineales bacterium]|nr:hypothetical protein [Anaerolineales bacterium]